MNLNDEGEMKERPILFSAPMVRAILEGKKTQTRRVIKKQPDRWDECGPYWEGNWYPPCPYGKPGDQLWVREEHYRFGHWRPVAGVKTKTGRQKWAFIPDTAEVLYDAPETFRRGRHHLDPDTPAWHKRLARFMPRSVCRTTLEIVDIRVEKLTDISEKDAKAEGAYDEDYFGIEAHKGKEYRASFCDIWCHINGIESWHNNTWVWVVEFKRIKP